MRKIEVKEWIVKTPEGKETKESLLLLLSVLVATKKPEELPKGFEQFKLFNRLVRAFEDAEKNKLLTLEEQEYKFLKDTIVRDIPMTWAGNPNIVEAVTSFMEAKEE